MTVSLTRVIFSGKFLFFQEFQNFISNKNPEKLLRKLNMAANKPIYLTDALTDETSRSYKPYIFLIKLSLVVLIGYSLKVAVPIMYDRAQVSCTNLYNQILRNLTIVEVKKEFIKPTPAEMQAVVADIASKRRVPEIVLTALIQQESSGGKALYHFEPRKYAELKGTVKASDDEVRMLASSHGPAHVMGFNAKSRCSVHWSELYDPFIGLDCGAKILREELDKTSGDIGARLWTALRRYNGSGPDAERYANEVMLKITTLSLKKLQAEL